MSSSCCTDNVSLNEFNLTSLENPSLSNQGNVNLFYNYHNTERENSDGSLKSLKIFLML